jgi:CheY-like chemotaxis protein
MANILIVDDSPDILLVLGFLLKKQGHAVVTAEDGVQALTCARTMEGLSLAFVDYHLPDMNGPQLTAELKKQREGIKVVLVSGEEGVDLQAAGADAFVLKPFTSDQVRKVIDSFALGSKAFSFTELLIAVCILSIVLAGMMEMFVAAGALGDISSKTQLAITEGQSEMEDVESAGSITNSYCSEGFPCSTTFNFLNPSLLTGTGSVAIDNSDVNCANLLKVTVSVNFEVSPNRKSDAPVTLTTCMPKS